MLVPQGMAYAALAGLPPVYGLYASTVPLVVYALLGSSRHLAVGPVAMLSLLVAVAVGPLAAPGSARYVGLALLLSLLAGGMQVALGLLRAGFVTNFFSDAVIGGFTSAAAVVIGASQLRHLLGVDLPSSDAVWEVLSAAARGVSEAHPPTVAIAVASMVALAACRRWLPRLPGALLVVGVTTLAVWVLGLDQRGVAVVGTVPRGLPPFAVPPLEWASVRVLAPNAAAMVFVGFMESIAIAKRVAAREGYRVDPNRELLALGLANVAGAFLGGYPVTGGLSRTAVNHQAGARTGVASLVTAGLVALTVLYLTPLFHYLPKAVLAAVVVVGVAGLVDFKEAAELFRIKRADGWTYAFTFGSALAFGVDQGIVAGVVTSLGLFVWRSAHPHTAELGFLESEGVFRNLARYPEARVFPGVLILRVDASLYFANLKFFEDRLEKALAARTDARWVIVDLSGVNDVDAVAVHTLGELVERYRSQGVRFAFASMKGPVRDVFARARWAEEHPDALGYLALEQALRSIGSEPSRSRPT